MLSVRTSAWEILLVWAHYRSAMVGLVLRESEDFGRALHLEMMCIVGRVFVPPWAASIGPLTDITFLRFDKSRLKAPFEGE